MKEVLAVLLLISAMSGTTFGAIVYSGSQNVTVELDGAGGCCSGGARSNPRGCAVQAQGNVSAIDRSTLEMVSGL